MSFRIQFFVMFLRLSKAFVSLFNFFFCILTVTAKTRYEGTAHDQIKKEIEIVLTGVVDRDDGREKRKSKKTMCFKVELDVSFEVCSFFTVFDTCFDYCEI